MNGSKWLKANKKYFNIKESENGNIYSLSKEGLNIIKEMNRLQGRGCELPTTLKGRGF